MGALFSPYACMERALDYKSEAVMTINMMVKMEKLFGRLEGHLDGILHAAGRMVSQFPLTRTLSINDLERHHPYENQ